mmetsp:Transcript_13481/g.22206  ORF Transcript_13481/g.22206 Transcript_13481/m.22206 type:complete len:584 (-) Transcript_13481:132-1883(-)
MAMQGQEDGQLLLERARELRKENLEVESSDLMEIAGFLNKHQAETTKEATHVILENYPDWWVSGKVGGRRAPPGLTLQQGGQDEEELFKHAATLFSLGIPLTLAERRGNTFRLFQDLDIWGSAEAAVAVENLLDPESPLVTLIGKAVGEVFPPSDNKFLDASIYDASGVSQTKGLRKTSIRIVWPAIAVDADRALRFRDFLISRLQAATAASGGSAIADLDAHLRQYNAQNSWHNILSDAAYGQRSAVRMPFNDRVSPLPLRAPEGRPFHAAGVMRFNYTGEPGKQINMKVEWLCRQAELEPTDWLKIGSIRVDDKMPLTEWIVPSLPISPMMAGAARGARVKVRTQGGSDGGGGLRMARGVVRSTPLERAGQIVEVHRRFSSNWDTQVFCDRMEKQCGQSTLQPDGTVTWKNPTNDARIEMHEEDRKITVVGKPNQVRSLIVFISQFTEACPGLASAAPTAPFPSSRNAPGSAFAPTDQGNNVDNTADDPESADNQKKSDEEEGAGPAVGQLRIAHIDFVAEGSGELTLMKDELARVTYDDPSGGDQESRWVYGKSEKSGECGWFPLDHTKFVEEPTERETY